MKSTMHGEHKHQILPEGGQVVGKHGHPDEKKGSLDGRNAKWVSLKDLPPV
jgi:hypothetical protein